MKAEVSGAGNHSTVLLVVKCFTDDDPATVSTAVVSSTYLNMLRRKATAVSTPGSSAPPLTRPASASISSLVLSY